MIKSRWIDVKKKKVYNKVKITSFCFTKKSFKQNDKNITNWSFVITIIISTKWTDDFIATRLNCFRKWRKISSHRRERECLYVRVERRIYCVCLYHIWTTIYGKNSLFQEGTEINRTVIVYSAARFPRSDRSKMSGSHRSFSRLPGFFATCIQWKWRPAGSIDSLEVSVGDLKH